MSTEESGAPPTPSFRDRIAAAAPPRKRERTTLGGVEVDVREMRAGEKNRITDASVSTNGNRAKVSFARYYPELLIACVVEPGTDTPVFTAADMDLINGLDAGEVDRIAEIAQRLSGSTPAAEKEAVGNCAGVDVG
jgi:hypothetical protein